MGSPFDAVLRAAGRTIEGVFGERFTLTPYVVPTAAPGGRPDVNARRLAEPAAAVPFTGIFVAVGELVHAKGRAMADNTTRPFQAEVPMIDVAVDAFPAQPARGDRIVRSETGQAFTVSRFEPTDCGRAWIHLNDGQAPER